MREYRQSCCIVTCADVIANNSGLCVCMYVCLCVHVCVCVCVCACCIREVMLCGVVIVASHYQHIKTTA